MSVREDEPCAICGGTGWIAAEGTAPRRVERCQCHYARQTRIRIDAARISKEYQACRFESFRPYNDTLRDAFTIAVSLADRYPFTPSPGDTIHGGLLLSGPVGVGKTHLAVAILRRAITNNKGGLRGLFWRTKELLFALRSSYNPTTQTTSAQILDPILACDLLVLDDLGSERLTDWVDDTMNLIVDHRYAAGLPMICTTNFPELPDDRDPEGLMGRIGERMHSRLASMCRFVVLEGKDFRKTDGSDTQLRLPDPPRARPANPSGRRLPSRIPREKDGKADLKYPGGRKGNA